ncbi:glycosyl transferase family 2 [Roseimicrobium gellanilyticum]|uniref:Glycosyl transferase family 2 n=1 Tax=Roseimicrobium gellanilyticum TaxID=748857 RepID=A0A366HDG4_9BACT|nr:glycosyltransferase family 2 protein [Roseimicrobium gellanilyticum]RBP39654.1 glycosyl transferase family 2 [Roseimicrobium gellanilyticum]
MHPAPRVSVIIATYNWSSVLRYSIESVLDQEFEDFEVLVIGDGCTDDSAAVAASFGDARVRWHNLPENSGNQSAPNNEGLRLARGTYCAYLGHDDIWHPRHLAVLVRAMDETGADFGYTWLQMLGPEVAPGRERVRLLTGVAPGGVHDKDMAVPPSSVMHRREAGLSIGGWKDYRTVRLPPDSEFLHRAALQGMRFTCVPELTVFKFNASWRKDSYVEKPCHEQRECLRRIREERDFRVHELQAVITALIRQHPESVPRIQVAEDVPPGEIVRRNRRLRGLERRDGDAPAPQPLPARLNLADTTAEPYLGPGWSVPETDCRWTDGTTAALVFSLESPQQSLLRMSVQPFLIPGKVQVQPVRVIVNGKFMGEWTLRANDWEQLECEVPAEALTAVNTLVLELPGAVCPLHLGVSADARELALRVAWMDLQPVGDLPW